MVFMTTGIFHSLLLPSKMVSIFCCRPPQGNLDHTKQNDESGENGESEEAAGHGHGEDDQQSGAPHSQTLIEITYCFASSGWL